MFGGEGFGDSYLDDMFNIKLTTDASTGQKLMTAKKLTLMNSSKTVVYHHARARMGAAVVGSYMWAYGGQTLRVDGKSRTFVNHGDLIGIRCMPEDVHVPNPTLVADLRQLLVSKAHHDVAIVCTDGSVRAHRAVLGMRSSYFRDRLLAALGTVGGMEGADGQPLLVLGTVPEPPCNRLILTASSMCVLQRSWKARPNAWRTHCSTCTPVVSPCPPLMWSSNASFARLWG